jgi:hypothetical protein
MATLADREKTDFTVPVGLETEATQAARASGDFIVELARMVEIQARRLSALSAGSALEATNARY